MKTYEAEFTRLKEQLNLRQEEERYRLEIQRQEAEAKQKLEHKRQLEDYDVRASERKDKSEGWKFLTTVVISVVSLAASLLTIFTRKKAVCSMS